MTTEESIGQLVGACHEARAEGGAMEVVGSVQQLRGVASLITNVEERLAIDEVVASCVSGAIERLATLAEKAVRDADSAGVEAACAASSSLDGIERCAEAVARGCRVTTVKAMLDAQSNLQRAPKDEPSPHAVALANGLGGCSAVVTAAEAGRRWLGDEALDTAVKGALEIGSKEGAEIVRHLLRGQYDILSGAALDASLDELSFSCQFGRRYERFAVKFGGFKTTALSQQLAMLDGLYVRLEDAYCDACVAEALGALTVEGCFAAAVEAVMSDVFFFLQRGIDRALSTLSEQAALARLNRTLAMLSSEVYGATQRLATAKVCDTDKSSFADALLAAVDEDEHGTSPRSLAAACCAAFICRDAVAGLAAEVVAQLAVSVPAAYPLVDDFDHLAKQYNDFGMGVLDALFEAPALKAAMHRFQREMPIDEIAARQSDDPKPILAPLLDAIVLARNPVLGEALAALKVGQPRFALCTRLAIEVANVVLAAILRARVEPLGALALRREARSLQALLATYLPQEEETTSYSIRPHFDRLTTALDLVNLEHPNDASLMPLKQAGLVPNDLRSILSRRADFEPAAIRAAVDAVELAPHPADALPDTLVYFGGANLGGSEHIAPRRPRRG